MKFPKPTLESLSAAQPTFEEHYRRLCLKEITLEAAEKAGDEQQSAIKTMRLNSHRYIKGFLDGLVLAKAITADDNVRLRYKAEAILVESYPELEYDYYSDEAEYRGERN